MHDFIIFPKRRIMMGRNKYDFSYEVMILHGFGSEVSMAIKSRYGFLIFVLTLSFMACNLPSARAPQAATSEPGTTLPADSTGENLDSSGGMQIRFTNLTDGGSISGTLDENGKPQVVVQFEVTGLAPLHVSLNANGMQ